MFNEVVDKDLEAMREIVLPSTEKTLAEMRLRYKAKSLQSYVQTRFRQFVSDPSAHSADCITFTGDSSHLLRFVRELASNFPRKSLALQFYHDLTKSDPQLCQLYESTVHIYVVTRG